MKIIKLIKFPDRKRTSICVIDTDEDGSCYVIGSIQYNEDLFMQALEDSQYVRYVIDTSSSSKDDK